jgi:preprotein translocase subunit SecA
MQGEVSKLNLRMPVELREDAAHVAAAMGVSLNTFIVHAVQNWTTYQGGRMAQRRMPVFPAAMEQSVAPAAASRVVPKVGANQPCPCGSGEKYKRCHGRP